MNDSGRNASGDTASSLLERKDWPLDVTADVD